MPIIYFQQFYKFADVEHLLDFNINPEIQSDLTLNSYYCKLLCLYFCYFRLPYTFAISQYAIFHYIQSLKPKTQKFMLLKIWLQQ